MLNSNPSSGHDPALPTDGGVTDAGPRNLGGFETLEGRIAAWCAWFGMEPPKLRRDRKLLDNTEQRLWLDDLTSHQERRIPLEEALDDCRKAVWAHRAAEAALAARGIS